jgi:hypothetical protein
VAFLQPLVELSCSVRLSDETALMLSEVEKGIVTLITSHYKKTFYSDQKLQELEVTGREVSSVGSMTDLAPHAILHFPGVDQRTVVSGTILLDTGQEIGFLGFILNFYLEGIECFLYGDEEWPSSYDGFTLMF